MDPFTSLSLAASIIQIVDFGSKLIDKSHEIYKNGSIASIDQAKLAADDLKELTQTLVSKLESASASTITLSGDELKLKNLAIDTGKVAGELAQLVDSVARRHGKNSKWKSVRQALDAVFSKRKIAELGDQLDTFRSELVLRIVVSLKINHDFQSARYDERFHSLRQECKNIAEILLDNKNFFTTGIDKLLQQHQEESKSARAKQEETIAAIATLQGHVAALNITDDLKRESLQNLETIQDDILNFLWFRFMRDRPAEISAPYTKTFQWIYNGKGPAVSAWNNLSEWFKYGQGCFWINGKAGSGKSTLMKFITGESRTDELLARWAKGEALLCASFYFWSTGTALQKSQEGLLRVVLHECLSQYPELVPIVFPTHCRQFARRKLATNDPSLVELKDAFKLLATQTVMPLKICLFIDGVDEYDGDHIELVEYLSSVSSPHLKLLLSSRPTPTCSAAFASYPSLRLQDLTQTDIRIYVEGNLTEHARMRELSRENPFTADHLIDEIVSKASGVFLWVVLVVKALRNGLQNHDQIQDLRRRLDELPSDLDNLYRKMLYEMDPFYKQQASRLLQIMYQSSQVPASDPMTALRLSFAFDDNPDTSIDAPVAVICLEEQARRCRDIEEIVRSRCCGLLEIYKPDLRDPEGEQFLNYRQDVSIQDQLNIRVDDLRSTFLAHGRDLSVSDAVQNSLLELLAYLNCKAFVQSEVHFLHKSVIDFLEKPDVWEELQNITSSHGFDPNVSLVSASLHQIKSAPKEFETFVDQSSLWKTLVRALHECSLAENSTTHAQDMLIEELDASMDSHWREIRGWIPRSGRSLDDLGHWSHTVPSDFEFSWSHNVCPYGSMFSLACSFGLVRYVKKTIESSAVLLLNSNTPSHSRQGRATLAQLALNRIILDIGESKFSSRLWNLQLEILEFSLKNGADPNLPFYRGQSPWQIALQRCNPRDASHCQDWKIIFEHLIEAGADVDTPHMVITCPFITDSHSDRNGVDVRLWQSPLAAIQDKYSIGSSSRILARKIKQVSQTLQSLLFTHGGSYQFWIEEEIIDTDGNRKVGGWKVVTDPRREEEILKSLGFRRDGCLIVPAAIGPGGQMTIT